MWDKYPTVTFKKYFMYICVFDSLASLALNEKVFYM